MYRFLLFLFVLLPTMLPGQRIGTAELGSFLVLPVFAPRLTDQDRRIIREIAPSGFLILGGAVRDRPQYIALVKELYDLSAPLIPWIMADEEGGRVSRLERILTPLPSQFVRGLLNDPRQESELIRLHVRSLRLFGINMVLAPCADVLTHPENRVIASRSFGSDPETVSRMLRTDLRAYAAENFACVPKHWPGHGSVADDSHKTRPRLDRTLEEMKQAELFPFDTISRHPLPQFLMLSHLLWTPVDAERPVSLSGKAVRLLRDSGSQAVLMTDDLAMAAVPKELPLDRVILEAIAAGNRYLLLTHPLTNCLSALRKAAVSASVDPVISRQIIEALPKDTALKEKYALREARELFLAATESERTAVSQERRTLSHGIYSSFISKGQLSQIPPEMKILREEIRAELEKRFRGTSNH